MLNPLQIKMEEQEAEGEKQAQIYEREIGGGGEDWRGRLGWKLKGQL